MIKMIPANNFNPMIVGRMNEVSKPHTITVGIPDNATYPNGKKVADVANMLEFGGGKVLPRPFVRNTIAAKKEEWAASLKAKLGEALVGGAQDGVKKALEAVGEEIKADVVKSIDEMTEPPLKPSTIKAKKKKGRAKPEKPLIDSGLMKRSLKVEAK